MGYDAGKKVKGRKRHAVVDTLGLMLGVDVLPVDIQDRDGCLSVLKEVRRLFPLHRIVASDASAETSERLCRIHRALVQIARIRIMMRGHARASPR